MCTFILLLCFVNKDLNDRVFQLHGISILVNIRILSALVAEVLEAVQCVYTVACDILRGKVKYHERDQSCRAVDFVGIQMLQFGDYYFNCTWCPSVALDFKLVISQLHSQTKVRDTDVTCENKQQSNVKNCARRRYEC